MRFRDIMNEESYLHDQDAAIWTSDAFLSDDALKRSFTHLGALLQLNQEFDFWLKNSKVLAVITSRAKNDVNEDSNLIVVNLEFQKPAGLPVLNEIQVSTVKCLDRFESKGLAAALYIVLAKCGYTVVSDFTQYRGGKALWKKLARQSQARNYVIRVWDDNARDWFKSDDGEAIRYNAHNLADDAIWHSIEALYNPTTLLVLSKK